MQATLGAPNFHLGYRPALDGIRGVAILWVMAFHTWFLSPCFGVIAVNTFFVLSGFLITTILISEWDKCGEIKLISFYLRRALRLLPVLLAMLLADAIYSIVTVSGEELNVRLLEVWRALFYVTNWAIIGGLDTPLLLHTWSLSLEEQFYVCWPLLLLLMLKKTSRASMLCWVALGVTISVTIRIFLTVTSVDVHYDNPVRLIYGLDTRADSLLIGCFVGIAAASNLLPTWKINERLMTLFSCLSALGLILLGRNYYLTDWVVCFGWLAASIFAAVIICQVITSSGTVMHWILENPVLVYIGKLSYSLYVWHFPILIVMEKKLGLTQGVLPMWLSVFPVAIASYYLIELPALRLKKRFQRTE